MSTARKWINVAVAMQSALAAPVAITAGAGGVTKASEGVVATATPPNDGSFILMHAQGMSQIDGRVFRTKSKVVATSFVLEGEDTTAYDTFASGTFEVITYGNSLTTATTINASGGDYDFIDTTTIHQNVKSQIPGLPSAAVFSMDNIWDVTDAGLLAAKAAADAQSQRAFKFTFGVGGEIMLFSGYVGANLLPGGTAQQLVTTKVVITMFGRPSYLPS